MKPGINILSLVRVCIISCSNHSMWSDNITDLKKKFTWYHWSKRKNKHREIVALGCHNNLQGVKIPQNQFLLNSG